MVISQGEVWWAELPAVGRSTGGFQRPVLVVQCDALNRSRIATVLCVPLTSNLKWALAPGNVVLPPTLTGLDQEAVANVTRTLALDREVLKERVGKLPAAKLELVLAGVDSVLGK